MVTCSYMELLALRPRLSGTMALQRWHLVEMAISVDVMRLLSSLQLELRVCEGFALRP